jgi:hypothetical protein
MAFPQNAPTGPKNQQPQQLRPGQAEAYHHDGTDNEIWSQKLKALRLQQQQRLAESAGQPSSNHAAYTSLQNGPAHQPQTTNTASQFAAFNTSTTNSDWLWNNQTENSFAQSSTTTATPQQTTNVAVPSPSKSLNPSTPSFSPEAANGGPVSPGHSQNVKTPAPSPDVCSVQAGVSQARLASDESEVTGGPTAAYTVHVTVPAPDATQNPEAFLDPLDQALARTIPHSQSVPVEQSSSQDSDSANSATADIPQGRTATETEAERLRLQTALSAYRTAYWLASASPAPRRWPGYGPTIFTDEYTEWEKIAQEASRLTRDELWDLWDEVSAIKGRVNWIRICERHPKWAARYYNTAAAAKFRLVQMIGEEEEARGGMNLGSGVLGGEPLDSPWARPIDGVSLQGIYGIHYPRVFHSGPLPTPIGYERELRRNRVNVTTLPATTVATASS